MPRGRQYFTIRSAMLSSGKKHLAFQLRMLLMGAPRRIWWILKSRNWTSLVFGDELSWLERQTAPGATFLPPCGFWADTEMPRSKVCTQGQEPNVNPFPLSPSNSGSVLPHSPWAALSFLSLASPHLSISPPFPLGLTGLSSFSQF